MAASTGKGPSLRAVDPWTFADLATANVHQLLSEDQRAELAAIASVVRFKKGAEVYHDGDRAGAVFNIVSGVVKAQSTAADGSERIAAFLFPDDVFGLPEDGRYVNSVKAITPVTAYQLPAPALRNTLLQDSSLGFHIICKLCLELRQTQRHAFLLARRQANARLALFLQLLEQLQAARGERTSEIYLPMSRSDIGDYVGMSLAAVSRGFRSLTTGGIIEIRNRRHVKIADRTAFERLAGDLNETWTSASSEQ
jgi:CRP/FNR family transcriptional regulator